MNDSCTAKQSHSCRDCYLKEAVHSPVPDSRLSWTLTNQILQVVLKALLVLQEAHGDIIVRFTLIQLGEEDPAGQTSCEKEASCISERQNQTQAHLLWKDLMSSMFLKMVSFWLLTSDGASGLSASFT